MISDEEAANWPSDKRPPIRRRKIHGVAGWYPVKEFVDINGAAFCYGDKVSFKLNEMYDGKITDINDYTITVRYFDEEEDEYTTMEEHAEIWKRMNLHHNPPPRQPARPAEQTAPIPERHVVYDPTREFNQKYWSDKTLTHVTIPATCRRIPDYCFRECTELRSVTILGNNLKEIEFCAFIDCRKLSTINLPMGLQHIRKNAFYRCYSLETISIPDSITIIDKYAFEKCKGLKNVSLPANLKVIDDGAFADCVELQHIDFPPTLEKIGVAAFHNCALTSVSLPTGVQLGTFGSYGPFDPSVKINYYTYVE